MNDLLDMNFDATSPDFKKEKSNNRADEDMLAEAFAKFGVNIQDE